MLELSLLREYVYTFGSTAAANALVISIFLGGLVFGSYWGALRHFGSQEIELRRTFALVQFLVIIYIGVFYLAKKYFIYQETNELFVLTFFIVSVLIPSLISGLSFALSVKILHPKGEKYTTYIYAVSTLGSVIGSIAHGIYFVPTFGLNHTYFIATILLAVVVFLVYNRARFIEKAVVILVAATVASLIYFHAADILFNQPDVLYSKHGQYGLVEVKTVDIERAQKIENFLRASESQRSIDDGTQYFYMLVNNEQQAFNIPADIELHRFWAESTLSLYENPVDVLTVGFASGVTAATFLESEKTRSLDIVEIAKPTIEAAKQYFPQEYEKIVNDERATTIIDDFRGYLRFTEKKYDIIVLDIFIRDPYSAGFYTIDFFNLLKKHLTPDGVVMIAGQGLSWSTTRMSFDHIYDHQRARGELLYLKTQALDPSFNTQGFQEVESKLSLNDHLYFDHRVRAVNQTDIDLYSRQSSIHLP